MKAKFTSGEWFVDGYEIQSKTCSIELAKVTVFNEGKANAHLMADASAMCNLLDILSVDLQVMFGERAQLMVDDINLLINKHRRT